MHRSQRRKCRGPGYKNTRQDGARVGTASNDAGAAAIVHSSQERVCKSMHRAVPLSFLPNSTGYCRSSHLEHTAIVLGCLGTDSTSSDSCGMLCSSAPGHACVETSGIQDQTPGNMAVIPRTLHRGAWAAHALLDGASLNMYQVL